MRGELVFASHQARVGHGNLRQHELCTLDEDRTLALFSAFGMPRLWGYTIDSAVAGFFEGVTRPHDGRMSTRLHQGLDGAQRALRARVDALIERRIPDVGLLVVAREGARVHVLGVGPGRAYLRRGARTIRLTPREDRAEGILRAGPAWCTEDLEAGDIVLGGSHTAFGQKDDLAELFDPRKAPEPQHIVSTLNGPAVEAGLGVCSFAFVV